MITDQHHMVKVLCGSYQRYMCTCTCVCLATGVLVKGNKNQLLLCSVECGVCEREGERAEILWSGQERNGVRSTIT